MLYILASVLLPLNVDFRRQHVVGLDLYRNSERSANAQNVPVDKADGSSS